MEKRGGVDVTFLCFLSVRMQVRQHALPQRKFFALSKANMRCGFCFLFVLNNFFITLKNGIKLE